MSSWKVVILTAYTFNAMETLQDDFSVLDFVDLNFEFNIFFISRVWLETL